MPRRTIVVETYRDFSARHGGRPAKIGDAWYFASGAIATQGFTGEMQMFEPPEEQLALLQNRRMYHAAKLPRVERDFQRLKGALMGFYDEHHTAITFIWDESEYGPVPPDRDPRYSMPDNKVWLIKLRDIVMQHRAEIEKIDKEIAEQPEAKQRQQQQAEAAKHDRELRNEAFAFQQEINGIEI
jgi:hypothetical protein